MNAVVNLIRQISSLTSRIETDYPELYKYLDENPMTLPASEHPDIGKKALEGYLQSLKGLLEHHLETHARNL